MPDVIDLRRTDDPRDAIHRAVQHLVEGRLVAFPTESEYVIAAYSQQPEAVAACASASSAAHPPRCVLTLRSSTEALDYLADPGNLAIKLMRRCWPGPVTLLFSADQCGGLWEALPEQTRSQLLTAEGTWGIRVPQSPALQEAQRLLPAPIVISGDHLQGGHTAASANELLPLLPPEVALVLDDGPSRYSSPATLVQLAPPGWSVIREGVVTERVLKRLTSDVILFVCTGNTCRSPMAEAILRRKLAQKMGCSDDALVENGFIVLSAGLAAAVGSPPSAEAVKILTAQEIDLGSHESQPLTPRLLSQADHVFTMTRSHRDHILWEYPELSHAVSLLSPEDEDISDPIGGTLEDYARCAEEITRHVERIADELPKSSLG